jgi:hypothetical protein
LRSDMGQRLMEVEAGTEVDHSVKPT